MKFNREIRTIEVYNNYNKMYIIIQNLTTETLELMITRAEKIWKALDIDLSLEEYLKLVIVMDSKNYSISKGPIDIKEYS